MWPPHPLPICGYNHQVVQQLPVTVVHQGCWSGSPSMMPWRLWAWWTTTRWKTQVGVRPAGCDPAGLWQIVFMPLIVVLFFQLDLTRTPSNCVSPPFNTPTNNAHASRRGNMSPSFPMFIVSYTTTVCDWPGGRLYFFFSSPKSKCCEMKFLSPVQTLHIWLLF